MSVFDFLATDDREFPRLYSPKKHDAFGKPLFRFDSEEDLNELELIPVPLEETYEDVRYYTSLPRILEADWQFSAKRCEQLIRHLREHMKPNKQYEFWHIWLANAHSQKTYKEGINQGLKSLVKTGMDIGKASEEAVGRMYRENEYLRIHFYCGWEQRKRV